MARLYSTPFKDLNKILKKIGSFDLNIELGEKAHVSSEITMVYENFKALLTAVRFGNESYYSGNLDKALENYKQAELLMKKTNNLRGISVCYNNEANVYKLKGFNN